MNNSPIHPFRYRALAYLLLPLLIIATLVLMGISTAHMSQDTRLHHALNTVAGGLVLLFIIFTIPFIIFGIIYWRMKIPEPQLLPPADNQEHTLSVDYTSNFLKLTIPYLSTMRGTLSWVNSSQMIRLVDNQTGTVIFETPYAKINEIRLEYSQLKIKVLGKWYYLLPHNKTSVALTLAGEVLNTQVAGIAYDTSLLKQAGAHELTERVRALGVTVRYVKVKLAAEYGFDASFIIMLIGFIFVGTFLVR